MKNTIIFLLLLICMALVFNTFEARKELKQYKWSFEELNTISNELQSKIDTLEVHDTIILTKIKKQIQIKYVQDSIIYISNNSDSLYMQFAKYTADTAYWKRYFPNYQITN